MGGAPRGEVSVVDPDLRRRRSLHAERAAHNGDATGMLHEQESGHADDHAEKQVPSVRIFDLPPAGSRRYASAFSSTLRTAAEGRLWPLGFLMHARRRPMGPVRIDEIRGSYRVLAQGSNFWSGRRSREDL
jgi:hypothetical protein